MGVGVSVGDDVEVAVGVWVLVKVAVGVSDAVVVCVSVGVDVVVIVVVDNSLGELVGVFVGVLVVSGSDSSVGCDVHPAKTPTPAMLMARNLRRVCRMSLITHIDRHIRVVGE